MGAAEQVPVTAELLAAGRLPRGGWSAAQLALVGVPWPPPAGWQAAAVGRLVPAADAARFVALRGDDRAAGTGSLFGPA